ncbi:MAG: hypothetical protein ACO3ZD_02830 [Cyanobium sp.]
MFEAVAAPVRPASATPVPGPRRTASARKRRFASSRKLRVCLDVDGVLADRTYGRGPEDLGDLIPGAVEFTRALAERAEVVIHSARLHADEPNSAAGRKAEARLRDWLDHHGFAYQAIASGVGKPVASPYVDDRGVSCRPMDNGPRSIEALDTDGQRCNLATLASDGRTLIPNGGRAIAHLIPHRRVGGQRHLGRRGPGGPPHGQAALQL